MKPGALFARRNPEPAHEAYVAVRMGTPIYYRVSGQAVEEIDEAELPPRAAVAVFDEFDVRVATPKAVTSSRCSRLLTRASGERLWTVNLSRNLGAVYGRAPARVLEFGRPVIAGAQIFDLVATSRGFARNNSVIGFYLPPRLAILCGYRSNGEQCQPQFAADPHDVELFVAEYARANDLPQEGPAALAAAEDLLKAIASAKAYPQEEQVFGIARSRFYAGAAMTGFALAAAALGYSGLQWSAASSAARQADLAQAETLRLNAEVAAMAKNSVTGVARAAGLDIDRLLAAAAAAWSPGAMVAVQADGSGVTLSARFAARARTGLPGDSAPDPERVRHAVERKTAAGMEQSTIAVERPANGFIVKYRAPSSLGALGARARE